MRCAAQGHTCEEVKEENRRLLQKLQEIEEENNCLKAIYGTVTQQLSRLHKYRGQIDAMKEQTAAISEAITVNPSKASDLKNEKDSLQIMLDEIAEELEQQKIQVLVYIYYIYNEKYFSERQDSLYSPCSNVEGTKYALCYKFRRLTIDQNCSAVCANEGGHRDAFSYATA